jgi:hypothetical protein
MTDAPQILLHHHLKKLRLPTFQGEYAKQAQLCAAENKDHIHYLARLCEMELIDRERRMIERRIKAAKFPSTKSLDSFDFKIMPSVNKPLTMDQVDGPVDLFLADGAYDGEATSDLLAARFGSTIRVTIPPPQNAILSPNAAKYPTARDCHIVECESHGRMAWQKASGYNQRSRGETLMGRWKTVIGPKLKAHYFENQKTETKIGVRVLNQMTELGRPRFERTA